MKIEWLKIIGDILGWKLGMTGGAKGRIGYDLS